MATKPEVFEIFLNATNEALGADEEDGIALTKKQIKAVWAGFLEAARAHLVQQGETLPLDGIGVIKNVAKPARMARNPATGEQVKVKAGCKIRFTAAGGANGITAEANANFSPKKAKAEFDAKAAAKAKRAADKAAADKKAAAAAKKGSTKPTKGGKPAAGKAPAKPTKGGKPAKK